jgi:hypothetical protein
VQQDFRGNVGQVVNGDMWVVQAGHTPPSNSHMTRICPQCGQGTWKLTRSCYWCQVDLFEFDRVRALIAQRDRAQRQARWLTMGAVVALLISYFSHPWPPIQLGSFGVGMACFFMTAQVLKTIPPDARSL